MITTAGDYIKSFKAANAAPKKARVPVKKQLAAQKEAIKNELIAELRDKQRGLPKDWQHGFNSAVTAIELYFGGVGK